MTSLNSVNVTRVLTVLLMSVVMGGIFLLPAQVHADEPAQPARPAVPERIAAESEGTIEVIVPEDVLETIMNGPVIPKRGGNSQNNVHKKGRANGWRIVIYSGPLSGISEGKRRQGMVLGRFSKYRGQVYTGGSAQNTQIMIGNFRTNAEANAACAELIRAIPQLRNVARSVPAQIIVR